MSVLLFAASGIAGVGTMIHLWLGNRDVVPVLLGSRDLDENARLTHYLCWHLITAVLIALALAFLAGGLWPGQRDLGLFASGLAAAFAALNLGIIAGFRLRPLDHAQWALFLPMAVCGFAGSWT